MENTSWKLEDIRIARPCRADWDMMAGNDRVRHCQSCQKNVYNVSEMTRPEGEALIAQHECLCLRLYRRSDGTVITSDCPVGINDARRPLKWLLVGFAALLAAGAAVLQQPAAATSRPLPSSSDRITPMVQSLFRHMPSLFSPARENGGPRRPYRPYPLPAPSNKG